MENSPKGLKYALSGRMEIHPCVLQDIGPLGLLPKKEGKKKNKENKSSKDRTWSAVPDALLGVIS